MEGIRMTLITLVIPCYNEAASLPMLITRCQTIASPDCHILLVDNGSTDDTPTILPSLLKNTPFFSSIRVPINQGYGHGIMTGLQQATTPWLAYTHADLQTDPTDVFTAMTLIRQRSTPAFIKGVRSGRPLMDRFFTIGMSIFETLLMQTPLWDINGQPTVFPRSFFESLPHLPNDFAFDLALYHAAKRKGLPILRFPTVMAPRIHGQSNWNNGLKGRYKFIKRTILFSIALRRQS